VYDKETRLWKKKQKHPVQAIRAFDLDGDGVPELVTGLSNGRLEGGSRCFDAVLTPLLRRFNPVFGPVSLVRNDDSGELIYKDGYNAGVAAIVQADYHLDGREEIMVCCEDGEVRGYLPAEEEIAGSLMDVQVGRLTLV
jgi:Bardet-Biedl syndrome 2 protein